MKCIAPRYASPVRGGGIRKHTSHTYIPPIVLLPPTHFPHTIYTPRERGHAPNLPLGPKF